MECDHIHSLIERSIKKKDLYVPQDYVDCTLEARKNPSKLKATLLSYNFFKNYIVSMKYKTIRPGSKAGDPQVIRALKYENSVISFKLSHNIDELWKPLLVRKLSFLDVKYFKIILCLQTSKTPKLNVKMVYPQLHKTEIPIKNNKYRDLISMKVAIPPQYYSFYDNIKHL